MLLASLFVFFCEYGLKKVNINIVTLAFQWKFPDCWN